MVEPYLERHHGSASAVHTQPCACILNSEQCLWETDHASFFPMSNPFVTTHAPNDPTAELARWIDSGNISCGRRYEGGIRLHAAPRAVHGHSEWSHHCQDGLQVGAK